ncbi:hypothetical protein LGQ02_12065 [Bacillus shivajii]|uniref:hypothetical protein n=1 Tax=Bacillus shivajii TaxID=1983719 RepID=UPI001CFBD8DC|nr:hypothetical protein [Bacillus shivajii]UCZ51603.1 hypothetical protein LGQ02_12065 [Bacillus shivajii]
MLSILKMLILGTMILLLVVGCSESSALTDSLQEDELFTTEEEAIKEYQSNVLEGILLMATKKGEQLFITNDRLKTFHISELVSSNGDYGIGKLTTDVSLKGTNGVSK